MIMLETDHITWDEYAAAVPVEHRPHEYRNLVSFLKNKGKASTRIVKESQWKQQSEQD